MIDGYYYLHTNGSLIFKHASQDPADFRESDLVRMFWPLDIGDRECAWTILVEALALGADPHRIDELATKWGCNNEDADVYAEHLDVTIDLDGNMWCAKPSWFENLQESWAGFGETKLAALADLCRNLGYNPSKTWGHTFKSLLEGADPANKQFGVGA